MDDSSETPSAFDPNKLFEPPDERGYLVYEPKLGSLPFEQVPWETFEKLSARLLEVASGGKVTQAFIYGRPGQAQYGIDVIALKSGSSKQIVMQCKRVQDVNRGQLGTWVGKFMSEKKISEAESYILCVPYPIESDNKLVEEWSAQARLLDEKKINAELWSRNKLNSLLREQPELVAEFFGDKIASSFCASAPLPDKYPERYRGEFESVDGNYFVFENETVRFDMFVPDERRPRVSASISFARADLSGITFTIPGSTLVDWLQWINHANDTSNAPYASRIPGVDGRHIFAAPDVRLSLDDSELEHIHWIFRKAWLAYEQAAETIESSWRFLRFDPVEETQKKTFALAKVSRQFWRTILEFARDHDCGNGESDWNIFDGSSGTLKVYVESATEKLERGYHLIMYAYQEGGITLPYEDTVMLGWAPLTSISEEPIQMHPRLAWDAEFTHEWIFSELVPAIKKWIEEKRDKENGPSGFFAKFLPRGRTAEVDLSPHIFSLKRLPVRSMSSGVVTLPTLIEYSEILQSYFHVYRRTAQISGETVCAVLNLLVRLTPLIHVTDSSYIRGNLHLGDGHLQAELVKLTQRSPDTFSNPAWVDMALRSLISLLREAREVPHSELVLIVESLVPLWERMVEDRLCDSLR